MDCSVNLKQRKDSDDSISKKLCESPIHQSAPSPVLIRNQNILIKKAVPQKILPNNNKHILSHNPFKYPLPNPYLHLHLYLHKTLPIYLLPLSPY